jgi:hypothetical protein
MIFFFIFYDFSSENQRPEGHLLPGGPGFDTSGKGEVWKGVGE